MHVAFPVAKSIAGASYNVVAAISTRGSSPGAPIPLTSRSVYIHQNIAHELGHGIGEEIANHLKHSVFIEFNREVGWFSGKLYDIQESSVAAAIRVGNTPLPQFEISKDKLE